MRTFLYRLVCFLHLRLGLYCLRSRVYRLLWERKYRDTPVPTVKSLQEIVAMIRGWTWTADSWREGWDAFSYPGAMFVRKTGDCDEFAVALCHLFRSNVIPGYSNPRICTIQYIKESGAPGGHNVCVLDRPQGRVAYMDYHMPEDYPNLADLAEAVRLKYAGEKSSSLGWGITDPVSLKPIAVHWR